MIDSLNKQGMPEVVGGVDARQEDAVSWLDLPRTPEPEVMHDAEEVEVYASAAAQAHLDAIDNTLVNQVLQVGPPRARLLDIGTGPGGIPLKIARRRAAWQVVGIDLSTNMVRAARCAAASEHLEGRVTFLVADGCRLPFPDHSFDVVISNSVLHHLRVPTALFREMERIACPGGIILMRDLRRPSRLAFPLHVRWHGRHYTGLMYKLFVDSVRASYTERELKDLLRESGLTDAQVFLHARTHIGFIRGGPGR